MNPAPSINSRGYKYRVYKGKGRIKILNMKEGAG